MRTDFDKFTLDVGISLFTAIIAAIVFMIMSLPIVDIYFIKAIPNFNYRLITKAFILIFIIFVFEEFINEYKKYQHN